MGDRIRKPAVAGLFYPDEPNELRAMINSLLEKNQPSNRHDDILGLVVPHAGYVYSGKSAAIAYNTLKESRTFKTAIIISPSHHEYFEGCSIYEGEYYQTPLGNIEINKNISSYIVENSNNVFFGTKGHDEEHALEVQLPFLQSINEEFDLVPIVIGDQSAKYIKELSLVLSQLVDKSTVIIVSSDLSHFHSSEEAKILDDIVVNHINNFEFPELYTDLASRKCEACGGGGIVALMETADIIGEYRAEVISHTHSGEVTGDNSNVVGYLSAVIFK